MMKRTRFLTSTLLALALMLAALLAVAVVSAQPTGSVSGRVYCDANFDYNYDAGEEIAGVMVTLYDDAECDWIPDTPAHATQDSAVDGTYSFTGLQVGGATWDERVCYFVEVDETAPELGNCNYIEWNPHSLYLYGNLLDWTNEDFRFQEIWDKTVDGQPWVPGLTITAETSDTIEVIEVIYLPQADLDSSELAQQQAAFILIESWNPFELDLVDVEWDDFTNVISVSGRLTWTVPMYAAPVPMATITKTFHVEPCIWESTTLQEELYGTTEGPPELIDQRPVVVDKTQPDLWIDSSYDSEVSPGEMASFTLSYGNNGGFENVTWIRNEFPPEALFDSANPAPDLQAADGSWVEWDLGSLSTGEGGSIDVTVAIQTGLTPSTTMVITDYIYNHVEQVADWTEITFHIEQPPLSLGDFVWYDADQDGIQDAGEPGVQDIVVDLYQRVCTGQLMASTTTDANGNYLFQDLYPGVYCLQFSNIPAGWSISPQNQGADDTVDSDADPATAQIININLQADDLDEDMGLYAEVSIGDWVWYDDNQDGIQDGTEQGIPDVTVTLYNCDGDVQVDTTTTDANGLYRFSDVLPGRYYLAFVPPTGYEFTLQNQGSDPALDSDPDPATGETVCFSFGGLQDDLTWDAGLYQPEPPPPPPPPPPPEEPPIVPESSTLLLLGGAISGLAGYVGLQLRARRRR